MRCEENNTIQFVQGEDRLLNFEVTTCRGVAVVREADYLLHDGNDREVKKGPCDVNGPRLSLRFSPAEPGVYQLEITYTVAPNTRKARFLLYVSPSLGG